MMVDEASLSPVNIMKIEDFLLFSPQEELHDSIAEKIKDIVLNRVKDTGSSGLIIDLTALAIVDSFLGRVISEIGTASRIMGAEVVITGLSPAVAMTMVEMGLNFKGIETARNLDKGLTILRRITGTGADGDERRGRTIENEHQ